MSNSVLSLNESAGEPRRQMRLHLTNSNSYTGSAERGDVVIKDSISQRSAWCDHILAQTDGVSLTSALFKVSACPVVAEKEESGSCCWNSITEFLSSRIRVLRCRLVYVSEKVKREKPIGAQCYKQLSPENAAMRHYLHTAASSVCIIPTCASAGAFQSSRS